MTLSSDSEVLGAFKKASAKLNAINQLVSSDQNYFWCSRGGHKVCWGELEFTIGGFHVCKFHHKRVRPFRKRGPRSADEQYLHGTMALCRKPYPICDCQVLMIREYKPVIFCCSSERCLKVQLITSPKKRIGVC
jgi:hypothetical protein